MMLTIEPLRWGSALALSGVYLAMCLGLWRMHLAKARPSGVAADWLVVYASQTGSAEFLAERTAATLALGGLDARAACISTLDLATLSSASRILFVCSTYGEGDAPDPAARFATQTMDAMPDLSQLHFGMLALGDITYTNYCGFGRALDAWLRERGATSLFERIDVDRGAPEALAAWQHHLSHLAGTSDAPDWEAPTYGAWRIAERTLLNPGSAGAPLYRLALTPQDGALPAWEAGDLAQVSAPADPAYPREYSIASIPAEGQLTLLVRLQQRADGTPGAASGWLCMDALATDAIRLRVRAHARFRLGENALRPLIAIGNGSGLAGLRALLKARIDVGTHDNWLLFGERNTAHDFLCQNELEAWRDSGALTRLDLAFSRDGSTARYVQHLVAAQADLLRQWVQDGAAIYVCGSLQGMAGGVHDALIDILGADAVEAMMANGRYRRDVY
ncbi:sulfite reductase (NADPH) flavoprotein alpha-component [Massilia aurea]|uniref:NADPH--hemoprotein reductase n=1 Tax=Massilia aurea TaxID=373040 RepID=A0A7W9X1I3_9BURK|nr:sulfite reductase subunit alpha [Massilia aurea]MBB6134769.1 sulfite reductase (NADPH) flavoprotein alpha-component [Massilia aurea]